MGKKNPQAPDRPRPNVISLDMDAAFFFERAVRSLDRQHYDKALKYFRRAVDYEPGNPVNHCNLAGVLSEIGKYEESNGILQQILDDIDPSMTECHFYMANNFANMENFEAAEKAIVRYLELDANGHFLEESEEMVELLGYELGRPTEVPAIKCREGVFEHDKARALLEEGRFAEAVRILQKIVRKHPDFTAARNNLALAYYYMGRFEKAMQTIRQVLAREQGNLHGLCNLAIFCQHMGDQEGQNELLGLLRKLYPYHQEHMFKLATTMGILGEHETAYRLFCRLIRQLGRGLEPCMFHYTAVAAYNTGRITEARKYWQQTAKLDSHPDIAAYYLKQLDALELTPPESRPAISYHYHLPFEEQFKAIEASEAGLPDRVKRDPLIRSSFFWALRNGDTDTKLQVIQAFAILGDGEVIEALKQFLREPNEDDYLKKLAVFVLRGLGTTDPIDAVLEGRKVKLAPTPYAPQLPVWEPVWQRVLELAIGAMQKRYDLLQQHDLETLWIEYLSRVFPSVPRIPKPEAWAAALEYWMAKMHRRAISYVEVAMRYNTTVATVRRVSRLIDETCGLRAKMDAIFAKEE